MVLLLLMLLMLLFGCRFTRECHLDTDGEVTCFGCPEGYAGRRCQRCADGYEGNPTVPGGSCTSIGHFLSAFCCILRYRSLIMAALCNRGAIIFLPCSFFLPSFFLLSLFSSPTLSGRRLDVCHTSTHGVALVRI